MENPKLPEIKDVIITHYGCDVFESENEKIYGLAVLYYEDSEKEYKYFGGKIEEDFIGEYINFINKKNKIIAHWSMNTIKYGFQHIERRFEKLTGKIKLFESAKKLDVSEFLKNKYGVDYVPRENGRLNYLAKINGFTGLKRNTEIINSKEISDRLELLFSIYQSESQNQLIISNKINVPEKYKKMFTDLGFQIFHLFRSEIKEEIKLASMSFLFDRLKRDKLVSNEIPLQRFFDLLVSDFDINLGRSTKFKSNISVNKYTPIYNQIKSKLDRSNSHLEN